MSNTDKSGDPKFKAGDHVAWKSQNGGDRREGIIKAFVPAFMPLDVAYPGIASPHYAQPDAMGTSRVDRYVIAVEPRATKFGKTSRGKTRLYAPNKGVIEREPGNPIKVVSAIPLFEVLASAEDLFTDIPVERPATKAEAVAILEGHGDEAGNVDPAIVREYETRIANGELYARVTEPIPAHSPQDLTVFGPNDYLEAHSPTHAFIKEEREKALGNFPPATCVMPECGKPATAYRNGEDGPLPACDWHSHAEISTEPSADEIERHDLGSKYPHHIEKPSGLDQGPVFVFEGSITKEQIERIKAEASRPDSRPIVLEGPITITSQSVEFGPLGAETPAHTVNGVPSGMPLPFPIHPPDRMGKLSRYPLVRSDFEVGEQLVSVEMRETIRTWPTGTAVMYNGVQWKVFGYPKAFLNRSRPMLVITGDETHPKDWQVVGPELLWRDMGPLKPVSNGPNVPRFDVNTGAMLGRNGLPVIGDNSNKRTGQKRAFKKSEPITKPKTEKPDQPSFFGDLKSMIESRHNL